MKAQAVEGNIEEIQCIRVECHHTHDPDEWEPEYIPKQGWFYPSADEAEYTADLAFAIATAMSWWAIRRKGFKLHVPRGIKPEASGNRCGWGAIPKRPVSCPCVMQQQLRKAIQKRPVSCPKRKDTYAAAAPQS